MIRSEESRLASEVRESSVVFKSGSSQTCLGAVASLRELGAAIYGVIDGGRPQVRLWVGWSGREWRDGGKVYYLNVSFASLTGSGGSAALQTMFISIIFPISTIIILQTC